MPCTSRTNGRCGATGATGTGTGCCWADAGAPGSVRVRVLLDRVAMNGVGAVGLGLDHRATVVSVTD